MSNSAGVRASFAMPTGSPVHEDVEHALGAAEVQHDGPAPPAARHA